MRKLWLTLVAGAVLLSGCVAPPKGIETLSIIPIRASGTEEFQLRVTGPLDGICIFVDGADTGLRTPTTVKVRRGVVVETSGVVTPTVNVGGQNVVMFFGGSGGPWVIQGSEQYLSFVGERETSYGSILLTDVGTGPVLYGYKFSASVTQEQFDRVLSETAAIWVLNANGCRNLRTATAVRRFADLRELLLDETQISDISVVGKLPHLTTLSLRDTPVGDITPVMNLHELRDLDVMGTRIASISPVFGLKKLREFTVDKVTMSEIQTLLLRTPSLKKLTVPDGLMPESQLQDLRKTYPSCSITELVR